jgi:MFS transporter, MHS family, proline/betaine transporter
LKSHTSNLLKAVLACIAGNWFELFDFTVYGYFAVQIGHAYFPAHDPIASVLATFATYGVGFLVRPIGGMILGNYGDRRGRRKALALTMFIMAVGTGLTGLIPPYTQWGIAAPILLVACRMLQGFSTGGEWGGATAFLVESAPENRRGFFGSLQQLSAGLASISAAGTALLLNSIMPLTALNTWGWRLPFLLGFAIAPIGYYLRMKVNETESFEHVTPLRSPLREALGRHRVEVLTIFGIAIIWVVAGYTFGTFTAAYATQTLKMTATASLLAVVAGAIANILTVPIVGLLSDHFGTRCFLIASALGFALLSWPLFHLVDVSRSISSLLLMTITAGILYGIFSGAAPTHLSQMLPTEIRYVSLSVGYSGAVMIFGGFAPFIATSLVVWTGSASSPSWYVIICAIVSLTVLLKSARHPGELG